MKIPGFKNLIDVIWKGFTINRLPGQSETFNRTSRSGISVTEENAMKATAVWACVRLLSETVASLPLDLFRRLTPKGKEKAKDHPLYTLLHNQPNPEMTSFQLRETFQSHLSLFAGNAYGFKQYDPDLLTVKAIWPLDPTKMEVKRNTVTKEIEYHYPLNTPGVPDIIPNYRIWHIPGLGFDGLIGYTPLTMAKEAIGLSLATEEMGARLFSQGMNFGAVATYPNALAKDAREGFKKDIKEKNEGLGKAFDLIVLENGATLTRTTIPPNDAQFLETRKFQRAEIASFFHVPPHMIGDLERATFSNIEEQSLEFVIYTIRPWLVRWEQSILKSLLLPWEQEEYYAEFNVDGLLRGDIESRYRAYAIGRNWGWLTPNHITERENMDPISAEDGGDTYLSPSNMLPADKFDATLPKPTKPKPQAVTQPAKQ